MRSIVRAAGTVALGALSVSLLAVPAAAPTAGPTAPAVSLVATSTGPAQQVLGLVNAERGKAGCPSVRLDSRLSAAAAKYSRSMAGNDFFSHTGVDGSSFVSRIEGEGYPTPRSENIAAGNTDAQATMRQWMNSPSHRRNILDCGAKDMGVGVASADDSRFGTYWTQEFGTG